MTTAAKTRYGAHDAMPDEYRDLLIRLLRIQVDTETYLLFPKGWARYTKAHAVDPALKARAVDGIAIAQEVSGGGLVRDRLDDLVGGPGGGGHPISRAMRAGDSWVTDSRQALHPPAPICNPMRSKFRWP